MFGVFFVLPFYIQKRHPLSGWGLTPMKESINCMAMHFGMCMFDWPCSWDSLVGLCVLAVGSKCTFQAVSMLCFLCSCSMGSSGRMWALLLCSQLYILVHASIRFLELGYWSFCRWTSRLLDILCCAFVYTAALTWVFFYILIEGGLYFLFIPCRTYTCLIDSVLPFS